VIQKKRREYSDPNSSSNAKKLNDDLQSIHNIMRKTIDDVLVVEEAQNLTKFEMLAILTRLGKECKIIINGDNEQTDIKTPTGEINGLSYAIELSKKIQEIKWVIRTIRATIPLFP
jgi:predicted ribonuclease YlaK